MTVFAPLDPIPQNEPPVEGVKGLISGIWFRFFSQLVSRSVITILRVATPVHRTGLSASIVATTLFIPSQPGAYRVSWTAHITRAAGTSSSVAVTIGWTQGGVACSKAFTALTGNTTATVDGDSVTIRPDAGIAVTYAVAYASVGAPVATYDVDVYGEVLP